MKKIKYNGKLDLNGYIIPCYVLEDGTRILSGRGLQDALKLLPPSDKSAEQRGGGEIKRFFNQKWFKSLIFKEEELVHFQPIISYLGDQKINGYEATVLADICDLVLQARTAGILSTDRQKAIADQCEILIRAFAKVGIIALVDEATGYQYDREEKELQAILKTFVSPEILEWKEAFTIDFYKEIFRLRKWPFTEQSIKKRPGVVGKYTINYIYAMLPKGIYILQKLKEKTPKSDAGNYLVRLHQSLTKDIGREALKKQVTSVTTLMSVSNSWAEFERLFQRKYGQLELPFGDNDFNSFQPDVIPKTDFDKQLKGLLKVPPPKRES